MILSTELQVFHSSIYALGLRKTNTEKLVGGLEHFLFSHILGIIIPID